MSELQKYGWQNAFADAFKPYQGAGFEAGRVSVENRGQYLVLTKHGEYSAEVAGKLLYSVDSPSELPKVGDWVVLSLFEGEAKAIIHDVLPRKSKFSRKVAGKKVEEQIVATNIDYIFVVQSVDQNFNLPRLERYLVMVREGGAQPIIVLNKIDLDHNSAEKARQVDKIAGNVPVIQTSTVTNEGVDALEAHLEPGKTYAFVGSSGVGKSALINSLVGADVQQTKEVRAGDSKGKHTTTRRELLTLPNGSLLIDTPGMREVQLWHSDKGLDDTFAEIMELADNCHFADCTHRHEKGCAVLAAVELGQVSPKRYKSYLKLLKEAEYLEERGEQQSFLASKRKEKELHRAMKRYRKKDYLKQ